MSFNDLGFLKFMEAFKFDSNGTSSHRRRIQMNFFECSLGVLKVELPQSFSCLNKPVENERKWGRGGGGVPSTYSGLRG